MGQRSASIVCPKCRYPRTVTYICQQRIGCPLDISHAPHTHIFCERCWRITILTAKEMDYELSPVGAQRRHRDDG